jgi:hypothetical protein
VREKAGTGIRGLSTHYGRLGYSMQAAGDEIEVRIEAGTRIPPGGLVVRSPADKAPKAAAVNGASARVENGEVVVRSLPATVRFRY